MKRIVLIAVALVAGFMAAHAQKFALVDMEYVLKNIPAYEMANEQLNQVSQRWLFVFREPGVVMTAGFLCYFSFICWLYAKKLLSLQTVT